MKKINITYGKTFRKLRQCDKLSLNSFKHVISKTKLSNFERGKVRISLEELQDILLILKIPIDVFLYFSTHSHINLNYGKVFRCIREQRGYQKNEFKDIELSEEIINDFEMGMISLPFDKIEEMMEKMNLSLSDYMYILSRGERDLFIEIFLQIEQAFYQNNIDLLEKIYKEKIDSPYIDNKVIAISAKGQYSILNRNEEELVSDFLMGVEYWTSFELFVLESVVSGISSGMLRSLVKDFTKNKEYFTNSAFYRHCVIKIMIRSVFSFLSIGDVETARISLQFAAKLLTPSDSFLQLIYKFGYGYYKYYQGEQKGELLMLKVIDTFEFLGDEVIRNKFQNIHDYYIKLQK